MIELLKNTKIDFMGKRYYAFILSGVLSALGIIAIIQAYIGVANLGIDFTGGTAVKIKFERSVSLAEVRKGIEAEGLKDFELQDIRLEKKILIRVKKGEESLGGFSERIISVLSERFSDQKLTID